MKEPVLAATALVLCLLSAGDALAQEAGNSVYGGARRNTSGVSLGNLGSVDPKDGTPAYFVEAGILAAASKASVFDLIKVDYVVSDMPKVRDRLLEEAARLIARKREGYARLLGVKVKPESVLQEKYNTFFPSEMYSAYVAYQTGGVEAGRDMRVLEQRKTSTFYFNPLHTAEFDLVIDPAGAEPVVQCTLYLKVKCRLEP